MRLLLDSHVFVWAKTAPLRIKPAAIEAIVDPANEVFVSVASAWELWIKNGRSPIPGFEDVLGGGAESFEATAAESGFAILPIFLTHAAMTARLPPVHADPFDRMLAAQCLVEGLALVTHDDAFDRFAGLKVLKT